MLLHGIEVPVQVKHGNTLNKPLSSWDDEIDVIVTNPPFGGTEEDGIEKNFPADTRTRETADLFLQLIIEVLAAHEGYKNRLAVPLLFYPTALYLAKALKPKLKSY